MLQFPRRAPLTARATLNRQAMSVPFRYTLLLIGLGVALVGPAWAQDELDPEPQLPEIFKEAIPL